MLHEKCIFFSVVFLREGVAIYMLHLFNVVLLSKWGFYSFLPDMFAVSQEREGGWIYWRSKNAFLLHTSVSD